MTYSKNSSGSPPHETGRLRLHRPAPGDVRGDPPVSGLRRHASRLLRVAAATGQCAGEAGPGATRRHACDLRAERRDVGEPAASARPPGTGLSCESSTGGAADARGRVPSAGGARVSAEGGHASMVWTPTRTPCDGYRSRGPIKSGWPISRIFRRADVGGSLAVVLDQYSRRVLAWRLARTRTSRLMRRLVEAAYRRRRPPTGLIFHSDRGSEFQGQSLQQLLAARDSPKHDARGRPG